MKESLRRDRFARLFVLANDYRIHPHAFTNLLAKSELINQIENNNYYFLDEELVINNFLKITPIANATDDSFGKINRAYWCGYVYWHLFHYFHRSFTYLFLIFPFQELLDLYQPYHEADISKMYQIYQTRENKFLLLKSLLVEHLISATRLAEMTKIPYATIRKYLTDNEKLYNASSNNIYKIAKSLNVSYGLFQKEI